MRKERDLCGSGHGTVVGFSVSQTGIFHTQPYQGFTENEKKNPVSSSCVEVNSLDVDVNVSGGR